MLFYFYLNNNYTVLRQSVLQERNITFTSALVHSNHGMVGPMMVHEAADGLERVPRSPLAVVTLGMLCHTAYLLPSFLSILSP